MELAVTDGSLVMIKERFMEGFRIRERFGVTIGVGEVVNFRTTTLHILTELTLTLTLTLPSTPTPTAILTFISSPLPSHPEGGGGRGTGGAGVGSIGPPGADRGGTDVSIRLVSYHSPRHNITPERKRHP